MNSLKSFLSRLILASVVCLHAAHGSTLLFSNSSFSMYNDHLTSSDYYTGTWTSTDGMTITETGNPSATWSRAENTSLYLQTPYPILDAAFALAVREALDYVAPAGTTSAMLGGDSPGGQYYYPYYYWSHTSPPDIREYTRDTAQHVEWGDSVVVDPAAAKGSMLRRCDFANNVLREDAVVTMDSVGLITAAWEYYKITGDQAFLSTTWNCFWNTINTKQAAQKQSNGLWTGATWADNVSGYITATDFNDRNTSVESLYANTVVAGAWQSLASIATVLGNTSAASTCTSNYNNLKTAINAILYRPEFSNYCYYVNTTVGTYYNYREDITSGLIYLYGIANGTQALAYHNAFVPTNYGYRNVDPVTPSGQTSYQGGNVFENEEGYHAWLMSRLGRSADLANFIYWHARVGLLQEEWQEGTINPSTGQLQSNYAHLVWGDFGYTADWTRGVFGITYNTTGITFAPCVPAAWGASFYAVLNNFTYRNSNLRVALVGSGTVVDHITLDGATVASIPATLTSTHNVVIYMSGNANPALPTARPVFAGASNVALGKTVRAFSSQYNNTTWAAANVDNGQITSTTEGWAAVGGATTGRNEWVEIDLGQTYNLGALVFDSEYLLDNRNLQNYQLYGSSTGAFTGEQFLISSGTLPSLCRLSSCIFDLPTSSARYLQFKGTSGYSGFLTVGNLEFYEADLAAGKTVTGFSSQYNSTTWAASNVDLGTPNVLHEGWAAVSGPTTGRNEWVTIDLGNTSTFTTAIFQAEYDLDNRNLQNYVLYGSSTGAFTGEQFTITSGTLPSLKHLQSTGVSFPAATARYLKLQATSGYSGYLTLGGLLVY
jgi:hypothetical protein